MEAKYFDITSECWLCPLLSFNCAPEVMDLDYRLASVELAEDIQIRRVTSEFTDYLYENHPDWLDAISAEYMAVLPRSIIRGNEITGVLAQMIEGGNLLFDLITALRLCHAGVVAVGPLIPANVQHSKFYMFRRNYVSSAFTEILPDISNTEIDSASLGLSEYEFHLLDVPTFNKLITEIRTYRESGKFSVLAEALRRFNSAYHGEFEDRLIDQMIAFESLYIADDKELRYKLALRTAFLLGKKRAKIFSDMKKAYDLRSQIVHGSKQVDMSKLEETIPKTEEYLRWSIRKFLLLLSQGYSLKELREHLLDENILKNGKILALRE